MWASAGTAGNGGESMCPCKMSHAPRYYLGECGELGGPDLHDMSASFQVRGFWEVVALWGPNQGSPGQTRLSWSPHE